MRGVRDEGTDFEGFVYTAADGEDLSDLHGVPGDLGPGYRQSNRAFQPASGIWADAFNYDSLLR